MEGVNISINAGQARVSSLPSAVAKTRRALLEDLKYGLCLRAGGEETGAPDVVRGRTGAGALCTTRGPTLSEHGVRYLDFNEDAGVVGIHPECGLGPETVFGGAF